MQTAPAVTSVAAFGGVPTFFRASCHTASRGGKDGYTDAGYTLAYHLHRLVPYEVDHEEWQAAVEQFTELLDSEDDEKALTWLSDHYPRCMALVPERRRAAFLDGVKRCHEAEEILDV